MATPTVLDTNPLSSAMGIIGHSQVAQGYGNNMFQLSGGRSFLQWASMYSGGAFYVSNACGVSGYRVDQFLDTLLPRFVAGIAGGSNPAWGQSVFVKPAFCHVVSATNSIDKIGQTFTRNNGDSITISYANILANFKSIGKGLMAVGVIPIMHTTLPRGDNLTAVLIHNAALKALCAQMGWPCFDAFEVMNDPNNPGFMKSGYNAILSGGAADNVHMNATGAQAYGKALAAFLMRLIPHRLGAIVAADSGSSWANGLAQTDSNSDGLPDSWTSGMGGNGTLAIVTDAAIAGKVLQVTCTADSGGYVRTPIKTGFAVGDWCLFQAKVKFAKSGSGYGPSFSATIRQYPTSNSYFFAGILPTTSFANANTGDGVFPTADEWMDICSIAQIPPNAGGATEVFGEFSVSGNGSVLSIAQTGVFNLTTGGATLP